MGDYSFAYNDFINSIIFNTFTIPRGMVNDDQERRKWQGLSWRKLPLNYREKRHISEMRMASGTIAPALGHVIIVSQTGMMGARLFRCDDAQHRPRRSGSRVASP